MKTQQTGRSYLLLAICFSIFLSTTFAMMLALPVRAAEYIVNSFDDAVDSNIGDGLCQTELTGNPCTLRAAIQESNASTQTADTVLLQPGIYTLVITGTFEDESATGDLDITGDITITGSGANTTTIQGGIGWDDRIFDILKTNTTVINSVTISGGNILDESGAGILFYENPSDDEPEDGSSAGRLILYDCRVTNNRTNSSGAGIFSADLLIVERCTIDNNYTEGDDGARGGGIYIATNGTLVMTNSTVSSNTAQSIGGGIEFANDSERSTLNNVTIVNNRLLSPDEPDDEPGGAGIAVNNTPVTITNSLLAGNKSGSGTGNDCDGFFAAVKFSLIEAQSPECTFGEATDNITGTAPLIGPLADNGGQTPTHALLENSPAINAGNPAPNDPSNNSEACYPTDQRGVARTDRCDMGAFEVEVEDGEDEENEFLLYIPLTQEEK